MKDTENYYLGLDMGTNSVGWAVTDEHYNLLRAKGKDLWGVRLFDEANTAVERRTNRISRRRRQREKARIGILKEFFAEEINKIDPGFYRRCDESKFWKQDRSADNQQPYALFSDKDYTDCDYYRDYPTIFHLREELIRSKQPHDVRLVYLAVLNIFKHRGHFLNVGDMNIEKGGGMDDLWNDMRALARNADIELPETVTGSMIEAVLADGKLSKTRKYEELLTVLEISKAKDKKAAELIKLLCGMSAKCSVLFKDEIADEEIQKKSLLFGDINYEAAAAELEAQITDESWELVEKVKEIYDNCLLSNIRKGCTYLSQARVKDYEKHKADLRLLKSLVAQYVPEEYDGFFRKMEADNYSAYVKSVNSKKEKVRRNEIIGGNGLSRDNFYKSVKKLLQQMPEDDERVEKVYKDIECGNFMPKQLTASNGVIPNQLHLAELHVILENASEYLPFLRKTDDTGLSIREKIEQLFKFQIPYYVGPVNDYHKGKGGSAWVVRTGRGQVLPWNMEEKIDLEASREEFILKMVRRCTYLRDEKVLPKNSLTYEKYMVLNELNNLKIRGEKPSVELKQSIYNDLFMTGKKVTAKKLKDYLAANGIIEKDEDDVISGIDGNFNTSLSSMGKFTGVLGERAKEWNIQQAIEDIIFWGTVYSNDKNMVRKSIDENYPEMFSDSEKRRILGFKFRDWGRFSREFLELEGIDKETGEVMSILQRLWEKNDNLMQLLSERYTYQDALQERIQQAAGTLSDITYKDIEAMNLSAPVRRMVWQTLLVLQDLRKVLEKEPKKIFVEMTRGDGEKNERKQSRKKKFQELYKKCGEEQELIKSLETLSDSDLRKKKLYLYYLQRGRCMYTGKTIEFSDLFNNHLYDIDHIYPRHFVKDDNIDNNLVLVRKETNAHKSDTYPIEAGIQRAQMSFWKTLRDGGFMNAEKFSRLTRKEGFTAADKAGFISRQLVETGQGTRIMTQILGNVFTHTEIVFPKGGNISDFRRKYELLKVRNVNDFHHAQDAYLSIVVGNSYFVKFTRDPVNFIKDYERDEKKYAYNLGRMFEQDIIRNGEAAWIASKGGSGDNGSIVTVKKTMARNTPLITRMNFEAHGGLTKKQTVYSKNKAKNGNYFPLKTSDGRLSNVEKYGGKMDIAAAYFFLVEHGAEGKRIRTLEAMPNYMRERVKKSEEQLPEYCENCLKLINPVICMKKIKMQSLIRWNGFYLHITGRSDSRLIVRNATELYLEQDWINYIKAVNNFAEKGLKENDNTPVTEELNKELFQILADKHTKGAYVGKPNSLSEKIVDWQDKFNAADVESQVEALLELLKMTECANNSMKAQKLGFSVSNMKINNKVNAADEFLLFNQSPSGLFESVIDLKTV
ncbi:MAG: type II CRISPR RNA-guided endonuclease Cas9 [Firmicutes bacterium]|nr:type II CRISPR RNA-guided endonuclease Cas9 [Bacillota bacterium]